ncbi:MAG: hypothetical protein D6731_13360 [Planctomycetota bacterium]|nr:MAG: hypothetical protein D6731_13360 [Planctomycetota bacterium]
MTEPAHDPRTPGRSHASALGRADLLRRLQGLALGPEALPRVLRLVEREVERALAARGADAYTASEILAAGGGEELVAALREARERERRVRKLRETGLADLSAERLAAVLSEARS